MILTRTADGGGSSGGNFHATSGEITAAAGRADNHMARYKAAVDSLYKTVASLSEAWSGTASDLYAKTIEEKRAGIEQIIKVICGTEGQGDDSSYTPYMRKCAKIIEDTDAGVMNAINTKL